MKKQSLKQHISFIFLIFMAFVWIIPLIWGVFTSFKSIAEFQEGAFNLLPAHWVLSNYKDLLMNDASSPVFTWFANSLVIAIGNTLLVLVVDSFAAFAYDRLNFKGKDLIFSFLLATMMFPAVVNIIPLYKIITELGWVNSKLAMIVPGAAGVFNIFLIRQFMDNIPTTYDEAARVDGANDFVIFWKIILPLSKPVLYVVALFTFTGSWNDFLWPSIVFNDINSMPITPGLQLLQGMHTSQPTMLMAGALIAIVPTFILYLFSQKYFLQWMSLSVGVKG